MKTEQCPGASVCCNPSWCKTASKCLHQQPGQQPRQPVAWRYWKEKFACWEYSDVPLEFPAVPAGTKMEPLYLGPNDSLSRLGGRDE
jgi:hypothetical protein